LTFHSNLLICRHEFDSEIGPGIFGLEIHQYDISRSKQPVNQWFGCNMNKWQIICPVVAMLLAGILAASQLGRSQARGMRAVIERHLGSVLSELEKQKQGGRFPSTQVARSALDDEAVAKRVHITSLFSTDDLYYNPTQPVIGTDALVLCARVRDGLFAIQADRKVRNLKEAEFQQAHLVPLAVAPPAPGAEPGGATNRSQPIRTETNRASAAAGSGR
jgi:hypothetical protein